MKEISNLEIIEEIYSRRDKIILNIDSESVKIYIWLKNEYKKGDIQNNAIFKFVFKSYYQLNNAGLGKDLKDKYFELLYNKNDNLESILKELFEVLNLKGKKTIQFSFATKLLHTLDNTKPIFDSEVSAVIGKSIKGTGRDAKIESAKSLYTYLEKLCSDLINDKKIKDVVKKFKSHFNLNEQDVSDQKILDFVIWSLGKLKNKI